MAFKCTDLPHIQCPSHKIEPTIQNCMSTDETCQNFHARAECFLEAFIRAVKSHFMKNKINRALLSILFNHKLIVYANKTITYLHLHLTLTKDQCSNLDKYLYL